MKKTMVKRQSMSSYYRGKSNFGNNSMRQRARTVIGSREDSAKVIFKALTELSFRMERLDVDDTPFGINPFIIIECNSVEKILKELEDCDDEDVVYITREVLDEAKKAHEWLDTLESEEEEESEIYYYDEVKEFFGDACFRMSLVRGGIIIPITEDLEIPKKDEFFRFGKYRLYCHDVTGFYIIGSFAC